MMPINSDFRVRDWVAAQTSMVANAFATQADPPRAEAVIGAGLSLGYGPSRPHGWKIKDTREVESCEPR
jgi:hypothetical protein